MKQIEILDISGDIGIRVFGRNLQEIFVNSAIGMYGLITELSCIEEAKKIEVSAESSSIEGLFVSWLNELIFHFDTYGFIGKHVIITETTPSFILPLQSGLPEGSEADKNSDLPTCRLKAVLSGEEFDPERHESKLLVKAATYHKLRIEKTDDRWEADVIFDI
jgi:SHS2 domain-containing protein